MDNLKRFLEESPLASKVVLTTNIVIHRLKLSPQKVGQIMESGTFTPSGDEVCELEIGGQTIARGRIVKRRGEGYFKVIEMRKGESI
jgi:hypothetical protein